MTATLPTVDVRTRIDRALGDPYDPANNLSTQAILAADEAGELIPGGEELLDSLNFSAQFVPEALGGQLSSIPELVSALRPIFSRDCALGLGYGVTSLMAGLNVFTAGTSEQQRALADRLLQGEKVSVAYHELEHGNDFTANDCSAELTGDGTYRLSGRKTVINNADRAESAVVFARTGTDIGRSHSLFHVDLRARGVVRLPRYRTTSVRGVHLAGLDFSGAPLAADSLVGARGTGAETALRSFQVSRTVMASAGTGPVETALFLALSFADARVLHGHRVLDFPHARATLALARALLHSVDLAVAETARLLHTDPIAAGPRTAALKWAAPRLLEQAVEYLAIVLGARFYTRTGPYALFGKHCRDLAPVGIGHAGGTSCLLSILPQLSRLLRDETGSIERPTDLAEACVVDGGFEGLAVAPFRGRQLLGE